LEWPLTIDGLLSADMINPLKINSKMRNNKLYKFIFGIVATIFLGGNLSAQSDSKYGADSATCVQNISLYREFYKQKNYKDATPHWRAILLECPASTEYMYADGVTLVKLMMQENQKDKPKFSALVDTLMMVYDNRIKYFGKEGYVLGRKGVDMVRFFPNKPEDSYKTLARAFELEGMKLEAAAADAYFQAALELLKKNTITKDEALDVYDRVSEVIAANIANDESYKSANDNVEGRFVEIADCASLVNMFGPKFKANPNDVALLKKITKMMDKRDCANESLYLEAAVNLDKQEPSADSKAKIAKMNYVKNNFSEAIKFYSQAIDMETDNTQKAQYLYEMAASQVRIGQNASAKATAQRAISLRSGWGKPYLLLGDIYMSSSKECGENDFQQSAVFWAAYDKYQQAKSVDPSVANDASTKMANCAKYFPKKSDAFFHGFNDGDNYNVGCFINETTKVRVQ
jgi:tetratricopeptide (TPR) repeat protein